MNIDVFKKILLSLYSKEMCYKESSSLWNSSNPCIGMCAITSMLVNDYFGYDIAKIKVDGISHYFNIYNNEIIDLTKEQFDIVVNYDNYEIVSRDILDSNSDTYNRYMLLSNAFVEYIKNNFTMISVNDTSYLPNFRYAVVTILEEKKKKVVLQRRGMKARDERGRLEEIGGAVEENDSSFKAAMERELREEVGNNATIFVDNEIGRFLCTKYDLRTEKVISWLFILFESFYIDGKLEITEPGKCEGYEVFDLNELPWDQMSKSSIAFNKYYMEYRGK